VTIRDGLSLLAGLAQAVAEEQPELAVRIRGPAFKDNLRAFVGAARVALSQAEEVETLLKGYGLPDTLLAGLPAAVDRLDSSETAREAGRNAHVGATADLDKVTGVIMRVLRQGVDPGPEHPQAQSGEG
jgi:hypothetical protein